MKMNKLAMYAFGYGAKMDSARTWAFLEAGTPVRARWDVA